MGPDRQRRPLHQYSDIWMVRAAPGTVPVRNHARRLDRVWFHCADPGLSDPRASAMGPAGARSAR